jgi:hypothetical protein
MYIREAHQKRQFTTDDSSWSGWASWLVLWVTVKVVVCTSFVTDLQDQNPKYFSISPRLQEGTWIDDDDRSDMFRAVKCAHVEIAVEIHVAKKCDSDQNEDMFFTW